MDGDYMTLLPCMQLSIRLYYQDGNAGVRLMGRKLLHGHSNTRLQQSNKTNYEKITQKANIHSKVSIRQRGISKWYIK